MSGKYDSFKDKLDSIEKEIEDVMAIKGIDKMLKGAAATGILSIKSTKVDDETLKKFREDWKDTLSRGTKFKTPIIDEMVFEEPDILEKDFMYELEQI